ncbi:MAG TPA: M28 family peptidase [Parvularculaceae bacterium]|nr:M28 family peptidase [Parvularculaceae bacterium]
MRFDLGRGDIARLVAAIAIFALLVGKGSLTVPPKIDPNGEFDVDRAVSRLERILGDERPHPVDSNANDLVRDRLVSEIRAIGFEPEIRDDFACRQAKRWDTVSCARVRNVLFRAGSAAGPAIAVTAHYDSVAAGPGASDDGAGLAAALEIASILRKREPVKPVIFLFTDGEEPGLIGAHSFVRTDPVASEIAAFVNMEARGASGPAIMFETSAPNGRDVEAFSRRSKAPVGNSLATDIYKMLPNDTDLSEFLALGGDAINFAYSDRLPIYHTPLDTIANLDRRSLAHLGTSALAGLDGFLRDVDFSIRKPEPKVVFVDILARQMLVAPQLAGLALIIFGLAASLTATVKTSGGFLLPSIVAPIIGVAAATAIAFGTLIFIAAIRPEAAYWSATPLWTRAVIYASSIIGGFVALAAARGADNRRVLAASWMLFAIVGVIAFFIAPGSALLFGLPAALFGCAALASTGAQRLLAPLSLIGLAAALLLWLSALHHAEIGLGLGAAWPFAGIGALLFLMTAPALKADRASAAPLMASVFAWGAVIILAIVAPAYSSAAPRPLNIQHIVDADAGEAVFALSPSDERPPAANDLFSAFEKRRVKGLTGERYAAPAPPHDGAPLGAAAELSVTTEGGRGVKLDIAADGADEIHIIAPEEAGMREAVIAGEIFAFADGGDKRIRCSGRACEAFSLAAVINQEPSEWTLIAVRYGLDGNGAALATARPDWTAPVHGGDVRLTISRIKL